MNWPITIFTITNKMKTDSIIALVINLENEMNQLDKKEKRN